MQVERLKGFDPDTKILVGALTARFACSICLAQSLDSQNEKPWADRKMGHTLTDALDGKRLKYSYEEMGTVIVQLDGGKLGFEWIDGPLKGQSGQGFDYRARQLGEKQFFVNWHEPEARGFVTLYLDLKSGFACSSVLAGYATEDEQALFHSASINSVNEL